MKIKNHKLRYTHESGWITKGPAFPRQSCFGQESDLIWANPWIGLVGIVEFLRNRSVGRVNLWIPKGLLKLYLSGCGWAGAGFQGQCCLHIYRAKQDWSGESWAVQCAPGGGMCQAGMCVFNERSSGVGLWVFMVDSEIFVEWQDKLVPTRPCTKVFGLREIF